MASRLLIVLFKHLQLFCLGLFFFSSQVSGKEVTIGMGNFEPYYIAEGETGIFTDIITAVFQKIPDHEPVFVFGRPNNRLWQDFNRRKVDAVSNLFDSVEIQGCRSDPVFRFRDVAITRAEENHSLEKIGDLRGLNIIAFQGAKEFFGPEFSAMIDDSTFAVASEPGVQAQALWDGRVDVSVGDLFIFLHSLEKVSGNGALASKFTVHDILPVAYSRMGFWDDHLCAEFNRALQKIKDNGEYEKIYDRYFHLLGVEVNSGN
ncbi:ABC transporter substrate-binding protein [Kiloniella sp. EL199]|uniref:substrate-binding periplasmic protein n=1 Tax=Kiloniella sp. EL199 TaxID=2107581 RepID=UPI0020B11981|nr:transporter substrate-binding domain-containing protein [Kiloniella sp. EL199]